MANFVKKKNIFTAAGREKSIFTQAIIDGQQLPSAVEKAHLQRYFTCFACIQQSHNIVFLVVLKKIKFNRSFRI